MEKIFGFIAMCFEWIGTAVRATFTRKSYRQTILNEHPVAYWSLGEPQGNIRDQSGNGHGGFLFINEVVEEMPNTWKSNVYVNGELADSINITKRLKKGEWTKLEWP